MKKLIITSSLVLVLLLGCTKTRPEEVEDRKVGTFVSVSVARTSFNESVKSVVTTTEGVFTIFGSVSGIIGDPVILRKVGNRYYLRIGGRRGCRVAGY